MSFNEATFDYLADLGANNTKAWFEENRERYETFWKAPALDFIAAAAERMARLEPSLRAEPRLNGSLRRINRDVRFSTDKSPYSARLHLVFWTGDHPNRSPGMHVVLSPEGVGYGAGQWGIAPERLQDLRERIVAENDEAGLDHALRQAERVGCRLGDPDLKRVPKGFDADGPQSELLRYKGFVARTYDAPAEAAKIFGPEGVTWVLEQTKALLPLIRWLSS